MLPLASELRLGELLHAQAAQQGHELKRFGRGDQFPSVTEHVFFVQKPLDGGRPSGWCAQSLFLHGLSELIVFNGFARPFHGAQERRF